MYIVLCGSIQAMNYGTSVISKEVREKTADFLLTKPVSRKQIYVSKILAVLASILITNIIYLACATFTALTFSKDTIDFKLFYMISITLLLVQLMFFALGVLVSVILPKIRSVLTISLSVVLGLFTLNMFSSVLGEETVRYFTPFKYYDTAYIMKNASYETPFVITEIVFVVLSILLSLLIYRKKDIHAV
jgi:ABC-2 type transport system permease protein